MGARHKYYFAGDTGFCEEEFDTMGKLYGPFDLAAIPIGAYEPRWFMRPQHIDPGEAVQIHQHMRVRRSIGIHWGTYDMGSTEVNRSHFDCYFHEFFYCRQHCSRVTTCAPPSTMLRNRAQWQARFSTRSIWDKRCTSSKLTECNKRQSKVQSLGDFFTSTEHNFMHRDKQIKALVHSVMCGLHEKRAG